MCCTSKPKKGGWKQKKSNGFWNRTIKMDDKKNYDTKYVK